MRGACPNPNQEGCPFKDTKQGCWSNTHHLYWPAHDYTTSTEKLFRELPDNKLQLCVYEHNEEHANFFPPEKPSRAEMLRAIANQALGAA